ncbi:DUF2135 domain-containing protein [Pedobacter sp. MC2016-14]|uniref:VIT domain-containing protein n=1 Tax=Pedobacter sp. MC2016-14 TaxID=2897327 RepID=UPI001E4F12E5|nr:VIT domain-containing protein [Pedobacter sp. MC2016-14]MCD0489769.1 DUF2135 domain-containing protein [Pedobacter sp. MC2016-14]
MKAFQDYLLALVVLISPVAYAQVPQIKIIENKKGVIKDIVSLKSLNIDVHVVGNIASTVMTMTFENKGSRILEGELTFPMPDGVSISSYALDINGKMRQAVPVEKEKATEVFESIERQRVDPGLLEKVEGNNFRTRIYPFPAGGSRTIQIGYEQELVANEGHTLTYRLPLDYNYAIPQFSLKTTVSQSSQIPLLKEQPDGSFSFKANGNTYTASMERSNFLPKHNLVISLPKAKNSIETLMQPAENSFYFLSNVYLSGPARLHSWGKNVGLIWDVSLSGLKRDTQKEIALLDAFIKEQKNLTITLGLLNNTFKTEGVYVINDGNWEALRNKLEHLVYDGGADYSKINNKQFKAAEHLFFTDGFSGFGAATVALEQPIYTINTAVTADYSNMKLISAHCGGKFLNLSELSVAEAAKQLNTDELHFMGIKQNDAITELYPANPVPVNGFISISGISSAANTSLTLLFGYGTTISLEKKVVLNAAEQDAGSVQVHKIWAQKKLSEMDVHYDQNKDEIAGLGRQFGIVTRNTSLLVLENVSDYIRYNISPPQELRDEYDSIRKQVRFAAADAKKDLLANALNMSEELKKWWNTDFSVKKKYPKTADQVRFPPPVVREEAVSVRSEGSQNRQMNRVSSTSSLQEVVVTGYGDVLAKRVSGVNVTVSNPKSPEIIIPKFKSDKAYMSKISGTPAQAYQQYLLIRKAYLYTPSFYLDLANWFYDQKDEERGLMILSNLTELELENSDIYKTLAYKLKQNGNATAQLFASNKVKLWRPMEAQSYRDYALALADCGKYQEALDMLYSVLTKGYTAETGQRDQGIEEIILTEINNLVQLHGAKLNTSKINPKYIQPLPVDVRVVLNWNKNDTDIDLWVTDPNGEKCFYSHRETETGGRISNDFTGGYGPEQFMIKKAIKGKYTIQVNYYGDQQISVSGATTVMAEIYTHYGSKLQQRKVITLQLSGKKESGVLVGEFSY